MALNRNITGFARSNPSLVSAQKFSEKYFTTESQGSSHPALGTLNRLCQATEGLTEVGHDHCVL